MKIPAIGVPIFAIHKTSYAGLSRLHDTYPEMALQNTHEEMQRIKTGRQLCQHEDHPQLRTHARAESRGRQSPNIIYSGFKRRAQAKHFMNNSVTAMKKENENLPRPN